MALSIDEANTVSSKYFDKTITQQVYERSPFFAKLKAAGNVTTDGGVSIQFPIRYQKLDKGQWVGPRDQVAYTQKETRTAGARDWKYLYGNAMISWDEVVKNSGKQMLVNLKRDKAEELREDMGDNFASAIWAVTQDSSALASMYTIVDAGETYAGIAVADAAEWAASIEDTSTTELVLYGANSISVSMNACTFGSHKPDSIYTTRSLWSKFAALIEPPSLAFHDAEVVSDVYIADGDLFLIDTKQFEIRYQPKFNMKTDPWTDLTQAGYPYASIKNCAWVGNVLCRMRKTSGKYTALDSTI